MPPTQEGPTLAGGLCTGLQSFSPAFLAITSVTVEKLQRLVPSFEAACASTEGVLRRPPSCLDAPRTLATDDLIGINSDQYMQMAEVVRQACITAALQAKMPDSVASVTRDDGNMPWMPCGGCLSADWPMRYCTTLREKRAQSESDSSKRCRPKPGWPLGARRWHVLLEGQTTHQSHRHHHDVLMPRSPAWRGSSTAIARPAK
jgi:hypothetical protein